LFVQPFGRAFQQVQLYGDVGSVEEDAHHFIVISGESN
jgi:hypothetical protein